MRIWSGEGGLMTDEQALAYIGHFGSLSAAVEHGDITLVTDSGSDSSPHGGNSPGGKQERRPIRKTRLADYL